MSPLLRRAFAPHYSFPNLSADCRTFENYLKNETFASDFEHTLPAVNVVENEDNFKITLAAPGLKKEDFNIKVQDSTLFISVEKENNEASKENFTRKEFSYGAFKRSFTLPKTVNTESISANYTAGILSLEILKNEEAKPKEPLTVAVA